MQCKRRENQWSLRALIERLCKGKKLKMANQLASLMMKRAFTDKRIIEKRLTSDKNIKWKLKTIKNASINISFNFFWGLAQITHTIFKFFGSLHSSYTKISEHIYFGLYRAQTDLAEALKALKKTCTRAREEQNKALLSPITILFIYLFLTNIIPFLTSFLCIFFRKCLWEGLVSWFSSLPLILSSCLSITKW